MVFHHAMLEWSEHSAKRRIWEQNLRVWRQGLWNAHSGKYPTTEVKLLTTGGGTHVSKQLFALWVRKGNAICSCWAYQARIHDFGQGGPVEF